MSTPPSSPSAAGSGAVEVSSAAAAEEDLLAWRPEFPILEDSTYLISNSLGAMPRGVRDALEGYADTWASQGVRAWEEDWWPLPERVGDAIGSIIGAPAGTVSTHQNVTLATAVALSCLDYEGERDRIVCSELNFPSLIYLYRQQRRRGAELHLVPSPDGFTVPVEDLVEAIDERTLIVPISHVIFRSGYMQDVESVVARAREVGALVLLDVYQSAGIMPLDMVALDVDFVTGGVLKWLCGGPGVSYLYVKEELIPELEPMLTGWFADRDAFAFDPARQRLREDSWRFLNGTPQIPALSAALPGLEILGQLDLEAVRDKSLRQTDRIVQGARERGWRVNTPAAGEQRGGHVTVQPPDAERVARGLLERRVMIDHRRGAGIRLAPHFYTEDEEIDHALEVMAALAEG